MSPPIDIDGSEIQKATIDGQNVNQVTIDGQEVFVGIPDSGMFQSPIYQFWAGSIDATDGSTGTVFPEVLEGDVSDATAVGDPTYNADFNGYASIKYDDTDDGHNWSGDSQLPTGAESFSWAVLIYYGSLPPSGSFDQIVGYGNANTNDNRNALLVTDDTGALYHTFQNNDLEGGTQLPTGSWLTAGVRYDGSNRKVYLNGSGDGNDSPGSVNVQNQDHSIGYNRTIGGEYAGAYVAEAILSSTAESDQAFADYHNDRIPP
jgi:hypothetical protein